MKKKIAGTIGSWTETELSQYLNQLLTRGTYKRAIDSFFMGQVTSYAATSVTGVGNAASLARTYTCQIRRTGEKTADGNNYFVLGDYMPVVGDIVECIWRDKASAYVLGPLVPQRSRYAAHAIWPSGTQADAASAWTKIPFSAVTYDRCGMFRAATSDFLIPIPGKYQVSGAAGDNGAAAGFVVACWRNGSELKRLIDAQRNTAGSALGGGSFTTEFAANDVLDLRYFNRDTVGHNILPGANFSWMSVQFVAGL